MQSAFLVDLHDKNWRQWGFEYLWRCDSKTGFKIWHIPG